MERGTAIVLIGFMGAGKTTVGLELTRLTDLPLYETDDAVAAGAGMSVEDFFATHGEEQFREAESVALAGMPSKHAIVATGGGVVLRPDNVAALQRLGVVIHLEADETTLADRLRDETEGRPILRTDDFRATLTRLLREREPLYRAAADFSVNTADLNATEVAQAILRHVGRS